MTKCKSTDFREIGLPSGEVIKIVPNFTSEETAKLILQILDASPEWTDFDESLYRFDTLSQAECKRIFNILLKDERYRESELVIRKAHDANLPQATSVGVHRMQAGDFIGCHTDEGAKEIRVLIYLGEPWHPNMGGILIFPNREDPEQTLCVEPLHNNAVAFMTGTNSEHAVSVLRDGCRYTLMLKYRL